MKKDNIKHTFVICAYQESEYLEECIKSLVTQEYASKVILVTSTPNGYIEELCGKYNITFFVNPGESGITQDWEFGLSKVTTKYATIAHQDDIYFESYSKRMVEELDKSEKPIIGFTDYYELRNGEYVKSDKNLRIKRILLSPLKLKKFRNSVFVRRRVLSMGNAICCPSVTYDMDDTPRPFFQNTFKSNGDWEAWERYSKMQGGFIYVNAPLMAHRIHNDSETSQILQDDGRSKEDFEMFKKFWPEWIARILVKTYKESEKSNEI